MTMIRCKNCRFWKHHTDQWNNSWNACGMVAWVGRNEKIEETGFALYADASDDTGLDAGLKTGPEFGCVLGEPKTRP